MVQRDHRLARHHAGEGHPACRRSKNRLAFGCSEIHATVARQPWLRWTIETLHHLDVPLQRPSHGGSAAGCRPRCRRSQGLRSLHHRRRRTHHHGQQQASHNGNRLTDNTPKPSLTLPRTLATPHPPPSIPLFHCRSLCHVGIHTSTMTPRASPCPVESAFVVGAPHLSTIRRVVRLRCKHDPQGFRSLSGLDDDPDLASAGCVLSLSQHHACCNARTV